MALLESNPDVMKFTPSRVPQSLQKTQARLKNLVEKEEAHAPLGVWAAESLETGEFIGWFMLLQTEFDLPELGFMIVQDHWKKGFASEVAKELIDYATKNLKYSGLMAVTDQDNTSSIHVLKKLGFQKVSSKFKYDSVLDREIEVFIFEYLQK